MAGEIRFLSAEDVLAIHEDTIGHEGGRSGVREPGLLEAAVSMPRQQFGGRFLHEGLAAMAAAYLYHLAQNHPFYDGNKRTAALASLVFLDANGCTSLPPAAELESLVMDVAASRIDKAHLTSRFRELLGG